MRYQPIEKHGIAGNMHSAALVSLDGSVDWLCLSRFDSPSDFAATFLMAPNDPRMRATVDAIRSPATRCGLPGVEGTFNKCSFLAGRGPSPGRAD